MSMDSVEAAVDVVLPAAEAKEEATNAAPSGDGDLRSEMVEFLKSETAAGEETPEPADEAKAPKTDEGDEPEVEAKAEESDDDEAEAKSGDEPEAKKKPSGWQKTKKKLKEFEAKVAERDQKVQQLTERESKWEHVTSTFQARLEEAEKRNAQYEERLRELGAGPDPREGQIAALERRIREQEADVARREREFEARQATAQKQSQARQLTAIKAQVAKTAEAHGLDPDDLAVRAAGAARAAKLRGTTVPSLDDVAAEAVLLQRHRAGAATERQAEVSQGAPRMVRGAAPSPVAPSFEANTEGALALLRSQGLI